MHMRRTLLLFTGIALIFPYMMAQFAVWDEVLSPEKLLASVMSPDSLKVDFVRQT